MKQVICLTGHIALVDDEDFDLVSQFKWRAYWFGTTFYATTENPDTNGPLRAYLHRFILGAKKGEEVDHENHCGLDCQRHNLRLATRSQNNYNHKVQANSTTGVKGVSWDPKRKKFQVYINVNRKRIPLGRRNTFEEAVALRDASAKEHHGEFYRVA